jgi:hypothetical protein
VNVRRIYVLNGSNNVRFPICFRGRVVMKMKVMGVRGNIEFSMDLTELN